jgi:hypothetical protein
VQGVEKGPVARRRPAVRVERRPGADARRGLSESCRRGVLLYVEPAVEGAPTVFLLNDENGPLSAPCLAGDALPGPAEPNETQVFLRPPVGSQMSDPRLDLGRRNDLLRRIDLDPLGAPLVADRSRRWRRWYCSHVSSLRRRRRGRARNTRCSSVADGTAGEPLARCWVAGGVLRPASLFHEEASSIQETRAAGPNHGLSACASSAV